MSEASRLTSQCQPASTGAALCTYVRTYARRSCLARFLQLSSCSFLMAIHRHGHLPEAISQGAHQCSEARACTYIARALHTYVHYWGYFGASPHSLGLRERCAQLKSEHADARPSVHTYVRTCAKCGRPHVYVRACARKYVRRTNVVTCALSYSRTYVRK